VSAPPLPPVGIPALDVGELEALADMLTRAEHGRHRGCGANHRPCPDCRRTAGLECVDSTVCGINDLCRPCAATWRCRLWRANPLRIRRWLRLAEGLPGLLGLPVEQGAELVTLLGRIVRGSIRRRLERERRDLARYLAATDRRATA
jgi:hypothetical protein